MDPSDQAVGAVLFQERPDQFGVIVHVPIDIVGNRVDTPSAFNRISPLGHGTCLLAMGSS